MYLAYVLSDNSRELLSNRFPPKYTDFIGHHITTKFGVPKETPLPPADVNIRVVGYINDPNGLEALVVSIDGETKNPNGSKYHITWSIDRSKFTPKDSNDLLTSKTFTLTMPINISVTPALLK